MQNYRFFRVPRWCFCCVFHAFLLFAFSGGARMFFFLSLFLFLHSTFWLSLPLPPSTSSCCYFRMFGSIWHSYTTVCSIQAVSGESQLKYVYEPTSCLRPNSEYSALHEHSRLSHWVNEKIVCKRESHTQCFWLRMKYAIVQVRDRPVNGQSKREDKAMKTQREHGTESKMCGQHE